MHTSRLTVANAVLSHSLSVMQQSLATNGCICRYELRLATEDLAEMGRRLARATSHSQSEPFSGRTESLPLSASRLSQESTRNGRDTGGAPGAGAGGGGQGGWGQAQGQWVDHTVAGRGEGEEGQSGELVGGGPKPRPEEHAVGWCTYTILCMQ